MVVVDDGNVGGIGKGWKSLVDGFHTALSRIIYTFFSIIRNFVT